MKILNLIDSLHPHGSARQLSLLAPAFASDGMQVEVCCLGPETPWATKLRQAGVSVHILDWARWFDFSAYWRLREILRDSSFDVIHVWGLSALRALAVVAKNLLPRVVMSEPAPSQTKHNWWDRRLLNQVHGLPFTGVIVHKRGRESFIFHGKRRYAPSLPVKKTTPDPFSVACVGKFERGDGFRQAIWAFDFLLYLYPNARLNLVGAGSQLDALRDLTNGLGSATQVQFLGALSNTDDVLGDADVVWLPTLANGGRQVALDAMALGKPVIASDVPCLREIIADGVTGILVPPGDVIALARRTKALLDDPALRDHLGAAARDDVESRFSLDKAVQQWRDFYRRAAA